MDDLMKHDSIDSSCSQNEREDKPKLLRYGYRKPRSRIGGHPGYPVKELYDHKLGISETRFKKDELCRTFYFAAYEEFLDSLLAGKVYTNEEIVQTKYFEYLVSKLNPVDRNPLTGKGKRHVIKKFRDAIRLFEDIRDNGIKNPLDFCYDKTGRYLKLHRGGRRLPTLYKLGIEKVPLRIFRTYDDIRRYAPETSVTQWHSGSKEFKPIHELAMEQFNKLGGLATDKYWIHGYTKIYDKVFAELRNSKIKILEFGVKYGASLKLWHDAFLRAQVFGVDKDRKSWKKFARKLDRVQVFIGNYIDEGFLRNTVVPAGPFDIIIDDCGHVPDDQIKCFTEMYPSLKPRGFYVIEDCWHSYRTDRTFGINVPKKISEWVDHIYTDFSILSIQFYYNLCIIQKGL